jgi:hypothetical protein
MPRSSPVFQETPINPADARFIFRASNVSTGLCMMTFHEAGMSATESEMEVLDTMTDFCLILQG